jgi:N-acetylneuraminate synthase/N,N'-diacetyllegionaminate synthase
MDLGANYEMPASRSIDIDTADDWHIAEALLAARPVQAFAIAGREIGPGHPCFVIAEAGVNHNGSPATAHALIDKAAGAGADAIKFQTFVPELLAEPGPHRDMLAKLVLPLGEYQTLQMHARDRGLIFLSSPFDEGSVDFLDEMDVPAFKVPSGEIVNLPLLSHIASKGKPVILSTGMSTMLEVARAVDALAGVPLALLHCVSAYPADLRTANLRAMETLRQAFGVPVGFSDHTNARATSIAALTLGASIIERHLTLDRKQEGPDHDMSDDPINFAMLVRGLRIAASTLGTGEKVPTAAEARTARIARRREGLRRAV